MPAIDPSLSLSQYFLQDHRNIDAAWALVEKPLSTGDFEGGMIAWKKFEADMRRHLAMEEEVIFPAFEQITGNTSGPTAIMRMEHDQMRGLLDQIRAAIEASDTDEILDQGDTLLMIIQQHNVKEEGVLYPMCDNVLAGQWAALQEKLSNY
jgi:hemerythrin-like domain-containing protein